MKKSRMKIISLFLAGCMLLACTACSSNGQEDGTQEKLPYVLTRKTAPKEVYALTFDEAVGKDVMPVGIYGGPLLEREYKGKNLPSMVSEKYFNLYEEMGLNFFTSVIATEQELDQTELILDFCDQYNIAAFLNSPTLYGELAGTTMTKEKIEGALSPYAEHKSVVGFFLRDEPAVSYMSALNKTVRTLKESKYSNLLAYYNAYPEWASVGQLSGEANSTMTYEEYLRAFVENLNAEYLSYDFYPWLTKSDGTEYFRKGYISNLSIVRKIAEEYKIPFWSCKQCGSLHENYEMSKLNAQPNADQFRWQMTIDLAYGAKGFTYFLLVGSLLSYDERDTWQEGMDAYYGLFNSYTGEPNEWFYYAKDFKAHLQLVDEVLTNACNEGVIAHGAVIGKEEMGEELREDGSYRELKSVQGDASVIGCFDYKGGTALYVTNNSYKKTATVTLNFRDNYGYDVYQGVEKTLKMGKTLSLELIAGEGALVVLR